MGSLSDVFGLWRALFSFVRQNYFIQVTGEAEGKADGVPCGSKICKGMVLKADRGTIVDRNGELIAADTLSYRLIAVLNEEAT